MTNPHDPDAISGFNRAVEDNDDRVRESRLERDPATSDETDPQPLEGEIPTGPDFPDRRPAGERDAITRGTATTTAGGANRDPESFVPPEDLNPRESGPGTNTPTVPGPATSATRSPGGEARESRLSDDEEGRATFGGIKLGAEGHYHAGGGEDQECYRATVSDFNNERETVTIEVRPRRGGTIPGLAGAPGENVTVTGVPVNEEARASGYSFHLSDDCPWGR